MNSLLRALLTDHLDPGYRIAHRSGRRRSTAAMTAWLLGGTVLLGVLLGVAGANAADSSDTGAARDGLLDQVRQAQDRADAVAGTRNDVAAQVDSQRQRALQGNLEGNALLQRIDDLGEGAAARPVHGPGLIVDLADGASGREGPAGSRSIVLDRDVRDVVNALWEAGAEAISVGDTRIGPNVTVRQAGGAILVDNRPVSSPYRIAAIGDQGKLHTNFVVSEVYLRLSGVAQLYGVGFDVAESDEIDMPGSPVRELRSAQEGGG